MSLLPPSLPKWNVAYRDLCPPGKASKVSCGNHRATSCACCPQGHGATWCNGECTWGAKGCVPTVPTQPTPEPKPEPTPEPTPGPNPEPTGKFTTFQLEALKAHNHFRQVQHSPTSIQHGQVSARRASPEAEQGDLRAGAAVGGQGEVYPQEKLRIRRKPIYVVGKGLDQRPTSLHSRLLNN
jgi:hypothetical protein